MCGIAGSVRRRDPAHPKTIEAQLDALVHRGPDSSGAYVLGRGAVGQTRLAVIDLVTGDPPIEDESGLIGVALNGEIYNFAALRAELRRDGHTLATDGDTEVIAHLAEDLDPVDLARRLDGMFAFAVWDSRRERLVLGRDRFGKKPLYVWHGADELVFGSEIKALLAHPSVPRDLDPAAVPAYLRFGYVPTPRTFFAGISSVPPGCVLVVDRDMRVTIERYWSPPVPGLDGVSQLDLSLGEAGAEVRRLLTDAVRRRLVSDVPLGAFLSGGIDSTVVVALMADAMDRPVRTFTIGFEDRDGFDERPYARLAAQRFHTEHTEFVVQPDAVDLVEQLVWHHDQPFGDSSAIPTWLLAELTRRHVTVALCGDGGDELFAGYERFAAGVTIGRAAAVPSAVRGALGAAAEAVLPWGAAGRVAKVRRFAAAIGQGLPDAYLDLVSYLPADLVDELVPGGDDWGVRAYRQLWASTSGATLLDRLLRLNLDTYLLDDLLPKVDRTSMAHALEVRAPFLDHHLLAATARFPPATKQRGLSLKRCLKAGFADVLPAELVDRPKRGFGVPLDRWFREDLAGYVDATLGAADARLTSLVRGDVVARILDQHRRGAARHGHVLWTLLTLEVFLRGQGW